MSLLIDEEWLKKKCVLCKREGKERTYYYPDFVQTNESIQIILCDPHWKNWLAHGNKRLDKIMGVLSVVSK